jgi:hypothetical protein
MQCPVRELEEAFGFNCSPVGRPIGVAPLALEAGILELVADMKQGERSADQAQRALANPVFEHGLHPGCPSEVDLLNDLRVPY